MAKTECLCVGELGDGGEAKPGRESFGRMTFKLRRPVMRSQPGKVLEHSEQKGTAGTKALRQAEAWVVKGLV